VVDYLKELDEEKILLTYGPLEFQKKKVQATGLDKVFDRVFWQTSTR
jgi:FMN phosphatase YigB (HAD superfamily)